MDVILEIMTELPHTKCWRNRGCIFNSNFPSYKKCWRENYSVEQCRIDNEKEWNKEE